MKQKLSVLRGNAQLDTPAASETPLRDRIQRTRSVTTRRFIDDEQLASELNGIVLVPGLIEIKTSISYDNSNHAAVSDFDYPVIDDKTVFFDLETTGLAGGSGTLAFLAGIGKIQHDRIAIRQFLITRYEAEASLLAALEPIFHSANVLVSYNGKTFDWPLLQTRRRMQRLPNYAENIHHLDLLYWIRRAFAKCWDDCRLQTVEKNLLNIHRKDDIAGENIPYVWSNWLRYGHWQEFRRVIDHHRRDIESLVGISRLIPNLYTQPANYGADVFSIAKYRKKQNQEAISIALLSEKKQLSQEERLFIAGCYKRLREWNKAVAIWLPLSEVGCEQSCLELSRYYERVQRNYHSALFVARTLVTCDPADPRHQTRITRLLLKTNSSIVE